MKIVKINKQEPYRGLVLEGKKVIEGRLNKGKFLKLKAGDILEMGPGRNFFKVVRINQYDSFKIMLITEGISQVLLGVKNIKEALKVHSQFYTPEQQRKFGALAIKIQKIKKFKRGIAQLASAYAWGA